MRRELSWSERCAIMRWADDGGPAQIMRKRQPKRRPHWDLAGGISAFNPHKDFAAIERMLPSRRREYLEQLVSFWTRNGDMESMRLALALL